MKVQYIALWIVAVLFCIFMAVTLTGCAIESPKAYFPLGNTGYAGYLYAGGGIAVIDPDPLPK